MPRLCAEAPRKRNVPDGMNARWWGWGGVDSAVVVVVVDAVASDRCVAEVEGGITAENRGI